MIRKRGKTYEVRAYNPAERKNVYVGSAKTRADARKLERDSEDRFARYRLERATVADFAERWLALYPRKEASSNYQLASVIRLFVEDYGTTQLTDVTRVEARAYAIAHPGRLGALRSFFSNAIDAGLATTNPFAKLGIPRSRGRADLVVLSDEELEQLLGGSRSTFAGQYGAHFAAAIRFAAETCIRPGELYALDWSDVDLRSGRASVAWQERRDGRARPKYDSQRDVVVPPAAVDALTEMPRFDSEHVFGSITGRRFSQRTHGYAWDKVRIEFGQPEMDFYELRHYGATKLLEMGVSAEDVAIQMGHTDGGELVRTLYGHPSKARALDRVQQAWLRDQGGNDGGKPADLREVS